MGGDGKEMGGEKGRRRRDPNKTIFVGVWEFLARNLMKCIILKRDNSINNKHNKENTKKRDS
jgi:hypothetical protein